MAASSYCRRHPKTETNLRCGRCEETICPQCMVYTPVGARCPDCGRTKTLPMFDVSYPEMAKATGVSLAIGIAGGFLIPLMVLFVPFFFVVALLAFVGLGYAIGEGVSASVNHKRGTTLQCVAVGGVAAAFLTGWLWIGFWSPLAQILGSAAGAYVAAMRFRI